MRNEYNKDTVHTYEDPQRIRCERKPFTWDHGNKFAQQVKEFSPQNAYSGKRSDS